MNEKTLQKSAELIDVQVGQCIDMDGVPIVPGKYVLKKLITVTPVVIPLESGKVQ
jgi:hypothetical protein